ncbi:hypothetical protein H257_13032 [Aphanomyces astaci]|uniref:Nucleoporin Nup133/Nup155-like C-terminal domain-containing protein n=1 Tax=Aphanomyces astaci TaxID=112090 RepID=W4FWN5_APHAT|nr:hypothetical protein H257_13032 [Aphanomyces astaci]ETV71902.1 hypothetical protein H257_13032 [Aphanomyces astaci]|eukprot:XP_009838751.1 hypothetical protein H257_13032 [Aphanomyces astaci]
MSRVTRYAKTADVDSLEKLSLKLTADLRNHIRFLGDYPVLSAEWREMARNMMRFGEISEMERHMPKQDNATLWECEELALRYILEDGKLNLCLRLLVEYKDYEHGISQRDLDPEAKELISQFERGLGVMLKNAWLHVEALQTTDLPLLLEYVAGVLTFCEEEPAYVEKKDLVDSQEILVVYYLHGLLKQLEHISEDRVMPLVLEKQLFALLASHIQRHWKSFSDTDVIVACEVLALLCDTEDFQTHGPSYVSSAQTCRDLRAIQEDILDGLMEDLDMRKKLRPLLDVVNEFASGRK